jgi:hypothetical protein
MRAIGVILFYCVRIFYADFTLCRWKISPMPFPRFYVLHNTVNAFTKATVSAKKKIKSQPTQTNNMQEIQFCPKKLQFCWVVLRKR